MEEDLQSHIRLERESFRDLANNRMVAIEETITKYLPSEITVQEREAIKEESKMQYEGAKELLRNDLADLYS